jgi:hypothetical protein
MWDKERREQTDKLRSLLWELSSLNRGSDFLGKVQRCIESADELLKTDFRQLKLSYMEFLIEEATKNE